MPHSLIKVFFFFFLGKLFRCGSLIALLFVAAPALAQSLPAGLGAPTLAINTSPNFPGANENVSVRIESFGTDLDRSTITWFLDGTIAASGLGKKVFIFKTGDLGKTTVVKISADTPDGVVEEILRFTPAEIDLLWEADGYVPPFYKGKALNSRGATIKVVAVPHFLNQNGAPLDPKNLIYTWKQDTTVKGALSGVGRQSYVFNNTSLVRGTAEIEVEAVSQGGSLRAHKRIILAPNDAEIVFYEKSPLLGVLYNRALGDIYSLAEKEASLIASPYYFSAVQPSSPRLEYKWRLNGQAINPTGQNQNELTLRQTSEDGGRATLSLQIQHLGQLLQGAREGLAILFGNG